MTTRPSSLTNDPSVYCANGTLTGVPASVRAVVGVTCILSMVGALLIILSYVLIKEIRTTTRKILLHLSIMDFVYAAGNSIGVFVNFDQYLSPANPTILSVQHYEVMKGACKAQAFFSVYGTNSSILWTNCMAVYIYLCIMQLPRVAWSIYVFYVLNYGLPLLLSLWFLFTGRLGYSPYGGSGWCSVIDYNTDTGERYPLVTVFANDIWIYLTVIVVPLIYISLKNMVHTAQKVEMKLLFIPVFFILLRMWSLLQSIIQIDAGKNLSCQALLFFVHIGGIGDSGQGFANAILFVLFTPKVRRYFLRQLLCCSRAHSRSSINNRGKSKMFYRAVQSADSENIKTELSDDDSPDTSSRVNEINPHSVLLNHNT